MTGLKDQITQDLKTAMLARDSFLTDTLKGLKAAILNQEIALRKRDEGLAEAEIEKILAREAKQREESAAVYEKGGNNEVAEKERNEKRIIMKYLPTQLSETHLAVLVADVIKVSGAKSQKDMGRVIGLVKEKVGSAADGSIIAKLVKAKLQ